MTELRILAILTFPSRPCLFLQNKWKVLPSMEGFWKKSLLSEEGIRRKEKSISCSISCPCLRSSLALFPSLQGLWRDFSRSIHKFHKANNKPFLSQKCCRKWRIASFCWCFSCFRFLGCKAARRMGASQNIWISLHGPPRSRKMITASYFRILIPGR